MVRRFDKRLLLVLAVSGGLLVWFLTGVHWRELVDAFRGVAWEWVVLAAFLAVAEYGLRAVRWMFLVRHVDRPEQHSHGRHAGPGGLRDPGVQHAGGRS